MSVRQFSTDYSGPPLESDPPETIEYIVRRVEKIVYCNTIPVWERKLSSLSRDKMLQTYSAHIRREVSKKEKKIEQERIMEQLMVNDWIPVSEDWIPSIEAQYQRFIRS